MSARRISPFLRRAAVLAAASALGACAAVTAGDGTRLRPGSDAFAEYVESVFRRQNETLSALAFELDDEDPETTRYRALESAEGELLERCDGLNALATARQRGERAGGFGALRIARRAPECERAEAAARALLAGGAVTDR